MKIQVENKIGIDIEDVQILKNNISNPTVLLAIITRPERVPIVILNI